MPLSAEEQVKLDALLEKYEYAPHSGSPTHWATKMEDGFVVLTTESYSALHGQSVALFRSALLKAP